MDCSPPGPSVHGILQTRIVGWVAFSRASSWLRDQIHISYVSCRTCQRALFLDEITLTFGHQLWLFKVAPACFDLYGVSLSHTLLESLRTVCLQNSPKPILNWTRHLLTSTAKQEAVGLIHGPILRILWTFSVAGLYSRFKKLFLFLKNHLRGCLFCFVLFFQSCEWSFIQGKMMTASRETRPQIALRNWCGPFFFF